MPDVVLTNVLTNAAHNILHPSEPTFTEGHKEEPIQTNSMISLIFALAFSFSKGCLTRRSYAFEPIVVKALGKPRRNSSPTPVDSRKELLSVRWNSGERLGTYFGYTTHRKHSKAIIRTSFYWASTFGDIRHMLPAFCLMCCYRGDEADICKYKPFTFFYTRKKQARPRMTLTMNKNSFWIHAPRIHLTASVCVPVHDTLQSWWKHRLRRFKILHVCISKRKPAYHDPEANQHDGPWYVHLLSDKLSISFVKSFKLASETRSKGCKEARNIRNVCLDSLHNISGTQLIQSNVLLHADHPVLAMDSGALRRQSKWRKCRGLSNGYTSSTIGFHSHFAAKWQLQWWPSQAKWKLQQPKRTIRRQGAKSTDSNFPGSPEHSDSLPHLYEFMTF